MLTHSPSWWLIHPRPVVPGVPVPARPLASVGPHSRVAVTGSRSWADPSAVRTALTRAWRDAGQPLRVVIGPRGTTVDAAARAWVAEHACVGHELDERDEVFNLLPGPQPWRVLAFVQNSSSGTSRLVELARAAGMDVHLWQVSSDA